MSKQRAILIAGPTASGKSAAALALAEKFNGVVINADSMQVYRELRILTARPSPDEEKRVPHRLYGHVPAAKAYSTGKWLEDVETAITEAEEQQQLPIVTGGTGLYFKALLEGLSPIPDIPDEIRDKWREAACVQSAEQLHELLRDKDPDMAVRLKPSDPQRIVRALEVHEATGRSLSEWQMEPGEPLLKEDQVARLYVSPAREVLYARIDARFDTMLEEGALEEVEALAKQKLSPDLPAMRALGVRPLMEMLSGDLDREAAVERAKTETRRYAKRQLTWARSNMISWKHIETKDSESLTSNIFSFIDV